MTVLAAFAAYSATAQPLRIVLALISLALLIVALAYATNWPRLLLKRNDGTRPWWAWLLLWPYYLLVWLSFWAHRITSRRPAATEIAPRIWLSRRLGASEARAINPSWQAILDLTCEFPRTPHDGCEYLSLPVLDGTAPSLEQISRAVDQIGRARDRGPVLLHCALGHGRSATVAVAWLLSCGMAESVEDGIAQVRRIRPGVGLNANQIKRLNEFLEGRAKASKAAAR